MSHSNLLLSPEALDNAAHWSRSNLATVVANATTDPFAQTRAEKIVENGANSQHSIFQTWTRGSVQLQQTFSIYLKAAERTTVSLMLSDPNGFAVAHFNLATGALTGSVLADTGVTGFTTMSTPAANGWWRYSLTATLPATTSTTSVTVYVNSSTAYTGDGASGVYAFGAQLESAPAATNYEDPSIATVGYGSQISYSTDGIIYTPIAQTVDPTAPESEVGDVAITNNTSAANSKEYLPGLVEPGEQTFDVIYNKAGAAALYAIFGDGLTYYWRLAFPDGSRWEWRGYLKSFGTEAPTEDEAIRNAVTMKVTSKPTFVAAL